MPSHKILLFDTPGEDEVQIDSITFTRKEFLEEIIYTLQGINMYNGHDTDTNKILYHYLNIYNSGAQFPEQVIIKYTDDLVVDDYVLGYLEENAKFVFTVDGDNIKYESLEDISEESVLHIYESTIETISNFTE